MRLTKIVQKEKLAEENKTEKKEKKNKKASKQKIGNKGQILSECLRKKKKGGQLNQQKQTKAQIMSNFCTIAPWNINTILYRHRSF